MKQTAVEWLHKLWCKNRGNLIPEDFQQAKEKEKQQIIDAYVDGGEKGFNEFADDCQKYYNETFKNK